MPTPQIRILMLSAGVITGAFRMMLDIITHIDTDRFRIYVAYKPEYAQWTRQDLNSILSTGAKIVPLRGRLLFDPRGLIDLWIVLRREKIHILHNWDVLGIPSRIIAKFAGSRIAEEIANPPPVIIKDISFKHYLINKWTSILVDGYAACSRGIMDHYLRKRPMFFRKKIISVIPNCIDVPDLSFERDHLTHNRRSYNIQDEDIILTNIGYFNAQKAQSDLIISFKKVVQKREDSKLIIIGWGPLEDQLIELTKELKLEDKVIFTGKLNRTQIFQILSFTDLFVLSSHWEGFGIVLIEAMSMGKAVISTATDGARAVIENGKTGIFVPIGNSDIMAETILHLAGRPEKRIEMGKMGRYRVIQNFDCCKYIQEYEKFYAKLIS